MKKPMNEMKVTFPSRSANEGFARATVAAVETDDAQLALAFLCKKGYTVPKDQPEADRVMGALARYGFAYEDIRRAMRRWMEEAEDE